MKEGGHFSMFHDHFVTLLLHYFWHDPQVLPWFVFVATYSDWSSVSRKLEIAEEDTMTKLEFSSSHFVTASVQVTWSSDIWMEGEQQIIDFFLMNFSQMSKFTKSGDGLDTVVPDGNICESDYRSPRSIQYAHDLFYTFLILGDVAWHFLHTGLLKLVIKFWNKWEKACANLPRVNKCYLNVKANPV